ncbi:MAG: hypothetical protein ACPGNV_12400 [Mangrovicoccus sp.]
MCGDFATTAGGRAVQQVEAAVQANFSNALLRFIGADVSGGAQAAYANAQDRWEGYPQDQIRAIQEEIRACKLQAAQMFADQFCSTAPNTSTPVSSAPQQSQAGADWIAAVIRDDDGYTNVRQGPSTSFPIVSPINDGTIFAVQPSGERWWKIRFAYAPEYRRAPSEVIEGYMHVSRIQALH